MTSRVPDHWLARAEGTPRNYDFAPSVPIPDSERVLDASGFWAHVRALAASRGGDRPVVALDTYPGVDLVGLEAATRSALPGWTVVDAERAALPIDRIDALIAPNLTDDRVFGRMSQFVLDEFYDELSLRQVRTEVHDRPGPTVVLGWGAILAAPDADVVVLVDLARWEAQRRFRAGTPNWRCNNGAEDPLRKFKRGYFVEWRVADRHKAGFFDRLDLVLDTNRGIEDATAVTGAAFREALARAAHRPFRVVPYFDPGVWGGYWMETMLGLEPVAENYAWCFDCVPEENSLLLADGSGRQVEVPSLDLVLRQPRELLGERTFARFGAEFPIRFDFLDTMGGGNLSLQVHPLTDYIRRTFGMSYTQDESYYLLDCEDDAVVYLGLTEGVDPQAMVDALVRAQSGDEPFPAEQFVNVVPVRKHDHVAIPAGTVHCSGTNSMVLEISATPYIFTFKLWDWDRVGLDGVPRPVHIEHGARNIQWDRDTQWVRENLVDRVQVVAEEPGHREERTGLHELEFIETRRHWFVRAIHLDTAGTVNVLNLVEGAAAVVASPSGAFEPFEVHYAETFIVPAAVGPYDLTPAGGASRCGVVVASVRGTATR